MSHFRLDHGIHGGLQGPRIEDKTKKSNRVTERGVLRGCLAKRDEQRPEQLVDDELCMDKGTQTPRGKDQQGITEGNCQREQSTEDESVIVTDPKDLYVVVDTKTTREENA